MTMLYRTPNVIIDCHEWHALVRLKDGRVSLTYRWRPLSMRVEAWQSVALWQGPKPKGIGKTFARYRLHIREAMEYEQTRVRALAGAERTARGTPARPAGRRDPHHHGLGLVA